MYKYKLFVYYLIYKMINNIARKVNCFNVSTWRGRQNKKGCDCIPFPSVCVPQGLTFGATTYLQPQPPPQRQDRMRISHTRSQLFVMPQPPQPLFPQPQPQLFKMNRRRMMSQQLQPQPFEPPFAKKFMVCTSSYFRISPTLPYAFLKKCVTRY